MLPNCSDCMATAMNTYAVNSTCKQQIDAASYANGVVPLDTLAAQWWNWLWEQITLNEAKLSRQVANIWSELFTVLDEFHMTPDNTDNQLLQALKDLIAAEVVHASTLAYGTVKYGTCVGHLNEDANGIACTCGFDTLSTCVGTGTTIDNTDFPSGTGTSVIDAINALHELIGSMSTLSTSNQTSLVAALNSFISLGGQANGYATLDVSGRIPYSQLPESAVEYKGTWNASTNTPTLSDGVGTNGDMYIVSVGGLWNGITFNVGDRIMYTGATATWDKVSGGNVLSVNGQVGTVCLTCVECSSKLYYDANNNLSYNTSGLQGLLAGNQIELGTQMLLPSIACIRNGVSCMPIINLGIGNTLTCANTCTTVDALNYGLIIGFNINNRYFGNTIIGKNINTLCCTDGNVIIGRSIDICSCPTCAIGYRRICNNVILGCGINLVGGFQQGVFIGSCIMGGGDTGHPGIGSLYASCGAVAIGYNVWTGGCGIAIGCQTSAMGLGVAIGRNATAEYTGVAIGNNAHNSACINIVLGGDSVKELHITTLPECGAYVDNVNCVINELRDALCTVSSTYITCTTKCFRFYGSVSFAGNRSLMSNYITWNPNNCSFTAFGTLDGSSSSCEAILQCNCTYNNMIHVLGILYIPYSPSKAVL